MSGLHSESAPASTSATSSVCPDKSLSLSCSLNLDSVDNFRDLGAASAGRFAKGLVYRGARPDFISAEDVEHFQHVLGIRTIIDLRDPQEAEHMEGGNRLLDQLYPSRRYSEWETLDSSGECVEGIYRRIFITFISRPFVMDYVWHNLSWVSKCQVVFWKAVDHFSQTHHAQQYVAQTMLNPLGMINQYKAMLRLCGGGVVRVLRLLSNPVNLPAMIHCAHGKDRTGIVSAVILLACGVSEDSIVTEDYARSVSGLQSVHKRVEKEICQYGLDPSFVGADPQTMQELLTYLREELGGVETYLVNNGFSLDEQEQLRATLQRAR